MKLVLGTMNFGPQVDLAVGRQMIQSFLDAGYTEIDSAYVYNEGATEKMLGQILPAFDRQSYSIATKVNPRITGRLDRDAVLKQCNESLERMNLDYVDILYLHMPDAETPVEEALEACAELVANKKVKQIGLSNFPSWLVAHSYHVCMKNGWPTPTVYQGLYNAISRKTENELFMCLRQYHMRFYAFNPLAGGLLSGKHLNYEESPESGRFARLASYRKRYWKKSYFEAVNSIASVCEKHNIKPAQAAYKWLAYHSLLNTSQQDAIIIGASTMEQFNANMLALNDANLPLEVLDAYSAAWEESKMESPDYFYFYSPNQ
jgi:aflatoxin B1 aldehyde reductase